MRGPAPPAAVADEQPLAQQLLDVVPDVVGRRAQNAVDGGSAQLLEDRQRARHLLGAGEGQVEIAGVKPPERLRPLAGGRRRVAGHVRHEAPRVDVQVRVRRPGRRHHLRERRARRRRFRRRRGTAARRDARREHAIELVDAGHGSLPAHSICRFEAPPPRCYVGPRGRKFMEGPTDDCLDEQAVVDFAAGALPADRAAAAEKHLAGCDRCAELVAIAVLHAHGTTGEGAPTVPGPPGDQQNTVVVEAPERDHRARPLLDPGATLGDSYRVLRFIGRGAMGEVYEVAHARLAGRYAAKVLSLDPASNPQAFSRFQREAMIASGLSHPNVLQVIDFRQLPDGRPYLVTEYLEGEDLAHVLVTGPLPLPRTMHLVRQMVSALSALHAHQVIHRDLKPQNIFVLRGTDGEPERVKLLDFGLAKRSNPSLVVTHDRALLGTPQYMAPEQALGNADTLGPESDQFSLAAIVYEMLSGRPPFSGDALTIVLYRIVHEAPPALAKLAPQLPAHVVAAVERGLAKRREDRFPSVKAFLQALEPEGAGAAEPRGRAPRRRAVSVVAGAAAVLAGGAIAGVLALRERPAPPVAATTTTAAAPVAAAATTPTPPPTTTVNAPEPAPVAAAAAPSAPTGERPKHPKVARKAHPPSQPAAAAPASGATPAPAAAPEQPEPHLIDKL
jgi:hypothetical protein